MRKLIAINNFNRRLIAIKKINRTHGHSERGKQAKSSLTTNDSDPPTITLG